jgi:Ca-activated chloride channel family protein
MTAAEIAQSLGIRVYTIGVGTNGTARYPLMVGNSVQYVQVPVEIDTETLKGIAKTTNGNFYRAKNEDELREIYHAIDQLEKSKIDVQRYSRRYEAYQQFALAALIVLVLEVLLRITIFRRIP